MKNRTPDNSACSQKSIKDLLGLIHITGFLSSRIHGARNQNEIFEIIEKEFKYSMKYNCVILLLDKNKSILKISTYSQPRKLITVAEQICKLKISDYELIIDKAPNFKNVVYQSNTIYVPVTDILKEMVSTPLVSAICKLFGISKRMCILTPIKKKSECIGVLFMASKDCVEEFITIVQHFAENISIALDLADETFEREVLQTALKESEELLRIERKALEEKNIALKEILRQVESEKKSIEHQFADNVEKIILPIVNKLKGKVNSLEIYYLNLIEKNLLEITSPFLARLSVKYRKLTPREIEVCNMIRNGLSSKEIADFLNISPLTVNRYREFIRRKLGITNKDVNMSVFLNAYELNE